MKDKEKMRQQLLEKTLGKNAKNRKLSSISEDLEGILRYQQESIEELSSYVSSDDIKKIHSEVERDFGITFEKNCNRDIRLLNDISIELKKRWHYDEMIDDIITFIRKSELVEKREYSMLIYNYKDIKKVLEDIAFYLFQSKFLESSYTSYVDFSSYTNKLDIFYQDMYECLYGNSNLIILDNIESLPVSFISPIISMLCDKKIKLMNRYVESQGSLKETNNVLVKDALSFLEWKNKYIILLSYDNLDDLGSKMGLPFINSIDEIKPFKDLSQDAYSQIIQKKTDDLFSKIDRQLNLKITGDLSQYIMNNKLDPDNFIEDFLEKVIDISFQYNVKEAKVNVEDNQLFIQFNEMKIAVFKEDNAEIIKIDQELDNLVGLTEVKEYLRSLKQYYIQYKQRKAAGKRVMDVSKHMIFTGNPGTGKTTVARILAKYLKASGILKSGHLIEVSRKDLVGQYVGHTAYLTSQVITSALGGVLFIDEAYSLYRGNNDSYGLEAIDTLVKAMEDNRDNLVVVLAGYKKEMEEFLTANSGLRSRFSNIIEFKDYTGEELFNIACSIASSKDYEIETSCKDDLIKYFTKRNILEGGNGRLARTLVEKAMINHSLRECNEDILILDDFIKEGR